MARFGLGSRASGPAPAGTLTPGGRAGIAVGVFLASVVASALFDHYAKTVPQAVLSAWYAAAAAGAGVLALTLPRRAAGGLALTCALLVGVLTYSHPARDKAATGVAVAGSTVGGWIHDIKAAMK